MPDIDPRGQRFAAALTSLVLAVALVINSGWLIAAQAAVFAIGVLAGPHRSPYALLYRALVRPRIGPPAELESAAPPRFAQGVGLGFALLGATGYLAGWTVLGTVATGFALGAAFLNAAVGLCLGCEVYLLGRRALATVLSSRKLTNSRLVPKEIR
ncbi:MAG TPA: DUF4395 domain-containing protein [Actinomycetes bacterium]|nr:DUF4395 domain-containing protein [Actinomycetes bacterium]